MMCGRATVSTDVGGVAECLDPERRGGVVVPARDPQAFATACLELLTDDERRHAMAAAARAHALSTATLDRALGEYRTAYEAATGRGPIAPYLHRFEENTVQALPVQRGLPVETLVGGPR
jgi:glycosyltransferase involved in cell wall biosynthesis